MFRNSQTLASLSSTSSRGRRKKESIFGGPKIGTGLTQNSLSQSTSNLTQSVLPFTSTAKKNENDSVFKRPILVEKSPAGSDIVVPNAKRKRLQVAPLRDTFRDKEEDSIFDRSDENIENPSTASVSDVLSYQDLAPKENLQNVKIELRSIGFTKKFSDAMDEKPDYIFRTELDGLKKRDNIVFTDLVRKDQSVRSCKNKFNNFVKARQGRFFYENSKTSNSDTCFSSRSAQLYPSLTQYVNKIKLQCNEYE